ncbi:MAG: hypothetical protein Q4C60_10870 [Eubacteriales bacterium]|nr:hypothetical protein [Eubacteriales bacterium]
MNTLTIVLLVILVVLVAVLIALYFLGKKAQKRQAEQEERLNAAKQTLTMLVIDKKRMKLKESGLPQMVLDQTPWYLRWQKLPIVKAKVGPQIVSLVCDEKIFDTVPVKREVKATISGIYIINVKGMRGKGLAEPPKKKSAFRRAMERFQERTGSKPVK